MTVLGDYAQALGQPVLPPEGGVEIQRYDELVTPAGTLRPGWKRLADVAVRLTEGDLGRAGEDIARMLSDDGVTYARPGQGPEPWRLDPFPLVLDAAEWARLDVGLTQRTELLNAILVDLYGPQRLLATGVVPARAVLGHAGFLRLVARGSAYDARPLLLAAADLGRTAEGEWLVLGDRAQAPSGIGYAMENRRVISRVLPELYREAGLHRVEPFLRALRSTLMQAAPADVPDPRVVVLTPGSASETAFDQAAIATTLGLPLVQGSDLVVRGGAVWMRVVDGLERVHVILRRVDAAWSDPLELVGESQLGVAGLAEAVRRGTVRVVNGLGAGILENPALLPYLPAACEALLGEPLRLRSVPTWWCGDPTSLEQVLPRLDALSLRTVDGATGATGASGATGATREALLAAPHRFVAQELPALSQAPSLEGARGVRPRPLTLRTFTLWYRSAYRPLLGGLATLRGTAASKDVWVLKASPGEADQGMGEVLPVTALTVPAATVPRVLEDLFWFGRYAERSEDLLRLLLTAHATSEDYRTRPGSAGGACLSVLMAAVEGLSPATYALSETDRDFRSLLLDEDRAGSVAQSLEALRDSAQGVRDQLSGDVWRCFGALDRAGVALLDSPHSHQVAESAGRMLNAILATYGVTASMMRDPGWHMIGAGRALERALQVAQLLRATLTVRRGIDVDRRVHNAVLAATESAVTHRRRYRGYVRAGSVLELLLLDPDNPRSVASALAEVRTHLAAMPASTGSTRPERLLDDLLADVAAADVAALSAIGGTTRPHLERLLEDLVGRLSRLATATGDLHFATGPAPRPLGSFARRVLSAQGSPR